MGHFVTTCFAAGGQIKAERLNAALPVAPGKGHFFHTVSAFVACADKITLHVDAAFVGAARCLARQIFDHGNAFGIGHARGQLFAIAVRHAHRCTCYHGGFVQRGHPYSRIFAP